MLSASESSTNFSSLLSIETEILRRFPAFSGFMTFFDRSMDDKEKIGKICVFAIFRKENADSVEKRRF